MTVETIADMVWALDHEIEVRIIDPYEGRADANFNMISSCEQMNSEPLLRNSALDAYGSSKQGLDEKKSSVLRHKRELVHS